MPNRSQIPDRLDSFLADLLSLAKGGSYEQVGRLPGAGVHSEVVGLSVRQDEVMAFIGDLKPNDRRLFVQAVAAYENTVGGIGSVTLLRWLFPLVEDPERATLDWILRHTSSYAYYAPYGTRSLQEYDVARDAAAARHEARRRRLQDEQAAVEDHRARKATERLPSAVRRGDLRAVNALIARGADPTGLTIEGMTLIEHARSNGRIEIALLLAERKSHGSADGRPAG